MEKEIIQREIKNRIERLDYTELRDLVGYLEHLEEVRSITSTRQVAMNEIQKALSKGYSF